MPRQVQAVTVPSGDDVGRQRVAGLAQLLDEQVDRQMRVRGDPGGGDVQGEGETHAEFGDLPDRVRFLGRVPLAQSAGAAAGAVGRTRAGALARAVGVTGATGATGTRSSGRPA